MIPVREDKHGPGPAGYAYSPNSDFGDDGGHRQKVSARDVGITWLFTSSLWIATLAVARVRARFYDVDEAHRLAMEAPLWRIVFSDTMPPGVAFELAFTLWAVLLGSITAFVMAGALSWAVRTIRSTLTETNA